MNTPFSTRPTYSLPVPILVPWVQALYNSVVDRSDIFDIDISENIGRPAVRSVFATSPCMGNDTLCE